jgi:hypothetical protein
MSGICSGKVVILSSISSDDIMITTDELKGCGRNQSWPISLHWPGHIGKCGTHLSSLYPKPNIQGYNSATLFLGGNKYSNLALQDEEVSKIEIIKYAHESCGTQTGERLCWRCPAKTKNYRPDFLSDRVTPHQQIHNCLKILKQRRRKIGPGFQMGA